MSFHLIDLETWARRPYYAHFIHEVVCTCSTTVNLDIAKLSGRRLYPAMLYLLTQTVNQMPESRTALTGVGLGIYDEMHPSYAIFNREKMNFSCIWTEFNPDYDAFLRAYEADVSAFAACEEFAPKPDKPENTFDVSMVPWFTFTSFNINVFDEGKYLLPVFTMGKFFDENGRRKLPPCDPGAPRRLRRLSRRHVYRDLAAENQSV